MPDCGGFECISRQTLHNWSEAHPKFLDALKRARDLALAWWEDQGQAGITMGKDFNATAFIFQMKNRFRAEYNDKSEIEHAAAPSFAVLADQLAMLSASKPIGAAATAKVTRANTAEENWERES